MTAFQKRLLDWYGTARRDLPWRAVADPYAVWVSETMLQQTTVKTVVPYFERWMARFPTVHDLARANADECASLWSGLGYYARCRRLHEGAKWVAVHGFPVDARAWLQIPGVGPYTAAAVASIAFGEPSAVVDGNVERVFARLNDDDCSGSALKRAAWEWADSVMADERPADWNQALMELGATVCRPKSPACLECPVQSECKSRRLGTVSLRPVREPKREPLRLRHEIWIPVCDGDLGVRRSPEGEWWAGLWGFPRSASRDQLEGLVGPALTEDLGSFAHTVTRHRIEVKVSLARCRRRSPSLTWTPLDRLGDYPFPAPQKRALKLLARSGARLHGTEGDVLQVSSFINA